MVGRRSKWIFDVVAQSRMEPHLVAELWEEDPVATGGSSPEERNEPRTPLKRQARRVLWPQDDNNQQTPFEKLADVAQMAVKTLAGPTEQSRR
jgi:hypothetical protein